MDQNPYRAPIPWIDETDNLDDLPRNTPLTLALIVLATLFVWGWIGVFLALFINGMSSLYWTRMLVFAFLTIGLARHLWVRLKREA